MKQFIAFIFAFVSLAAFAQEYKEFRSIDGVGIKDANGNIVVPCRYDRIEIKNTNRSTWFVVHNYHGEGAYNSAGKLVADCEYSYLNIREEKNGEEWIYAHKKIDGRTREGVLNSAGKIIVPFAFKDVFGYATVVDGKAYFIVKDYRNGRNCCGVYDSNGKVLAECKYKDVSVENIISVRSFDDKYGAIDLTGKIILDCSSVTMVFCSVKTESGLYYSDFNIGGEYIADFNAKGGKYGLIMSNPWRVSIPAKYDDIVSCYGCDYFRVNEGGNNDGKDCKGGKWGVVDKDGKVLIPIKYDEIDKNVEAELFTVKQNGKWGVADCSGRVVVPIEYDAPVIFKNDVASVKKDGEVRLIKNPLVSGESVQIAENTVVSYKKQLNAPVVSRYPAPDSDVDKDIPQTSKQNENTFAFIVANENYPDAPVPYSLNDGRMFAQYCKTAFGLPEKNVMLYEDATYGSLISMMEKVKGVAEAYEGDATVIIYYAGHGFPDEKQSTAYLLPIDGSGSDITSTGYSLAKLYDELAKMPLKNAVVFLDACFSGAKREDDMLAQSRGVAIKVKQEQPKGNLLVFSASQGDETAHQLEDMHHGLFTYHLLKGIQMQKGNVTLGELTTYVTKQVKRQSVVINGKKQTPTVIPSPSIADQWQTINLR